MQNLPQRIEIPLNKSRTAMLELVWFGFALGALYLAYNSLDPFYWQTIHINIEGTTWLMRQLPVAARVGILGLVGLLLLLLSFVTMQRLLSDAPALVMDADGIEGYKNNITQKTVRLRWDEIGDMTSHYGTMSIYSKRESMLSKRKVIIVQTDTVGKSANDIVAAMQAFIVASKLGVMASPQARQYSQVPQRARDAPLPEGLSMAGPAPVHQPAVVTRPSSAMANAAKPSFGTRRNS